MVIDGAINNTTTVNVGVAPGVNPATNKIYVANGCGNVLPVAAADRFVAFMCVPTNSSARCD
jgi:DNA-binding beta-propeller fold protein YncE